MENENLDPKKWARRVLPAPRLDELDAREELDEEYEQWLTWVDQPEEPCSFESPCLMRASK